MFGTSWKAYTKLLHKYPISTKIATGGILTAFGDLLAQHLIERHTETDLTRLATVSAFGVLVSYVEGHLWLGCLERMIGPSMGLKASLAKTLLDQGIFAPIETSTFMCWTHWSEGQKNNLETKLRTDLPKALAASYLFWGPVCLFEFLYVPFPLRVLYLNTMSIVWDTFLSFASHNSLGTHLPTLEVL